MFQESVTTRPNQAEQLLAPEPSHLKINNTELLNSSGNAHDPLNYANICYASFNVFISHSIYF